MSRVRILLVQHAASLSGAVVSTGLIASGLDHDRYEVVVACTHPAPEVVTYYQRLGVRAIPAKGISEIRHTTGGWERLWNPFQGLRFATSLMRVPGSVRAAERLIAAERPDIVHLNSVVLVPAAIAAQRVGVPLVWHVRESVVRGHAGVRRRRLARLVQDLPDAAIFLSEFDMRLLGTHSNWHVIPNALRSDGPPPAQRGAARQGLGIPEDTAVVLFLGGYSLLKGADILLRALPVVAERIPKVRCLLVGAHEPSSRLAPRAARLVLPLIGMKTPRQRVGAELRRVGPLVTVLPWQDDTGGLFAAADVLAFPAVDPHFPRPVVEAMAHGVPVVASNLGGINEIVRDGVTGWLARPRDPTDLARALTEALTHPVDSRRMAETARAEALMRFDAAEHVRQIADVYEDVLSRRHIHSEI